MDGGLFGRIDRKIYWICVATLLVAGFSIGHAPTLGLRFGGSMLLFVAWVVICANRLHDLGRSGWWILAPIAVFVTLLIGAAALGGPSFAAAFDPTKETTVDPRAAFAFLSFIGLWSLMQIGLIVWLGVLRGDPHQNQFGSPPREAE